MSATPLALQDATIRQHCKVLHLPTVADQCGPVSAQAVREGHTHLGYLEALLADRGVAAERISIVDPHAPHVIDLLDAVEF